MVRIAFRNLAVECLYAMHLKKRFVPRQFVRPSEKVPVLCKVMATGELFWHEF